MSRLEGKVVVITGAGSGMGRAGANLFAREGARIVAAEWHPATLEEVAAEVKDAGGEIIGVQADVSDRAKCEQIIQTAIDAYGRLDVLWNNAGIMDNFAAAAEVDDEIMQKVFGVNVYGPTYMIRAAIPHMLGKGGSIINSSSLAGIGGGAAGAVYTMSKHAVIGLTKNTAFQYAKEGVRCNAMAIGAVQTNIMQNTALGVDQTGMGRSQGYMSLIPAYLEALDVANLALFLASDESAKVNGAVINIDAGWSVA